MQPLRDKLDGDWVPRPPDSHKISREKFELISSEDLGGVIMKKYLCDFDGPDRPHQAYEVIEFLPQHEILREEPLVFMQGFMSIASDYEDALATLAENTSSRVIAWNELKGVETGSDIRYPHETETTATQLAKVLAMDTLLDMLEIKQANLIAHSEGAIHALLLALLDKDRFGNIILTNPAGIVNNDSFIKLFISALQEGINRKRGNGENGTPTDDLATGYRKLGDSDFAEKIDITKHALTSMWGISHTDVTEILSVLKEHGITIVLLCGDEDKIFPAVSFKDSSAEEFVEKLIVMENTDHPGVLKDKERLLKYIVPIANQMFDEKPVVRPT